MGDPRSGRAPSLFTTASNAAGVMRAAGEEEEHISSVLFLGSLFSLLAPLCNRGHFPLPCAKTVESATYRMRKNERIQRIQREALAEKRRKRREGVARRRAAKAEARAAAREERRKERDREKQQRRERRAGERGERRKRKRRERKRRTSRFEGLTAEEKRRIQRREVSWRGTARRGMAWH